MKSYTDLEQSKKLAEILPKESADMCYLNDGTAVKIDAYSYNHAIQLWEKYYVEIIPCWSLAALLELMPHCIIGWDGLEYTRITKGNVLEYSNQESGYEKSLISIPSNNLLSPAYNMIIWLKENKYI